MSKLLIFSIFFFLFNFADCQKVVDDSILPDSNLTFYDLFYLSDKVEEQEQLVKDLNNKISLIQDEYNAKSSYLNSLKGSLDSYKILYGSLLKTYFILKNTLGSTSIFVFSADSFSKAFLRYSYLRMLVNYIKNVTDYILLLQEQYSSTLSSLDSYKRSINLFLVNYMSEKQIVDSNVNLLLRESRLMQQKSEEIRITISGLYENYSKIESTIIANNYRVTSDTIDEFVNISSPLNDAVIISSFGIHDHPYLKNVEVKNDGVDLFSRSDTLVKCAFKGKVVAVLNVPNYGHSVVCKHGDYYTVYSNLNLVFVSKDTQVAKEQVIATISKSTSKYSFACLNFQVWHETNKLNPVNFIDFQND